MERERKIDRERGMQFNNIMRDIACHCALVTAVATCEKNGDILRSKSRPGFIYQAL